MNGRDFIKEFEGFTDGLGVARTRNGAAYLFPDFRLRVTPVTLEQAGEQEFALNQVNATPSGIHGILLFEDRWLGAEGPVTRARIAGCLGHFRTIFARKCNVTRCDILTAGVFLDRCHSYGSTAAKYKYSMRLGDELVAVATFSGKKRLPAMAHPAEHSGDSGLAGEAAPRLVSCEWIRYASLPDVRIAGGMGKMLQTFLRDVAPDEVLSYSDNEWSDGDVYRKLGFTEAFRTPPQMYYVNRETFTRTSALKVGRDNLYKESDFPDSDYLRIWNAGSTRWFL